MREDLLLEVRDLRIQFETDSGTARAVDGVSFGIRRGETLVVVGESGSGKSVSSLAIMGLLPPPGRVVDGAVLFRRRDGRTQDLLHASGADLRQVRGNEIAMVFQEPMSSLNPVYTIGNQIADAVMLHQRKGRREAMRLAADMLDRLGIPDAAARLSAYPHQISGGMAQRVMIAMALSCRPSLLIADEPTTALDVTIQAQILELIGKLQHEFGMAVLFITHNLGVVAEIADRVVVMYAGRVVEEAATVPIFAAPRMPYTAALLRSVPRIVLDEGPLRLTAIPGEVPDPACHPPGCAFHPRCAHRVPGLCDAEPPSLVDCDAGHKVRCVRWHELAEAAGP